MDRETVISMLGAYRKYLARSEYLKCRETELERDIARSESTRVEDAVHITQAYEPGGGSSGRISKPTERLAIMFADGVTPDTVQDIRDALRECREEIRELGAVVGTVEAWMKVLSEREKLVVIQKTMEGCTWNELSTAYSKAYPEEIFTKRSLRNKMDVAISKILEICR